MGTLAEAARAVPTMAIASKFFNIVVDLGVSKGYNKKLVFVNGLCNKACGEYTIYF
jgi:hypothetical protein